MKTFVSIKTGNRFPEHGQASWFRVDKKEYFIRLGYDECSKGWKKFNSKKWRQEEIPDFAGPIPYPDAPAEQNKEWIEYAQKYGTNCAMEFLNCCDYSKPGWAHRILNPRIVPSSEDQAWFTQTFGAQLLRFETALIAIFLNTFSFDIFQFEKFLANNYGYDTEKEGSMKDFMTQKFGAEAVEKFRKICLKNY